jgi:hypothetical protein
MMRNMPRMTVGRERGAALIVGLVMLALITVVVASSFSSSHANTQAIGNMQFRDEAIAAANKATEQVIDSPFWQEPQAETIEVDIDHDDTTDYEVAFAAPTCESATRIATADVPPSSAAFGSSFAPATSAIYQTVWDLDASVQHVASGTQVRVHQGVRVLLSKDDYDDSCAT